VAYEIAEQLGRALAEVCEDYRCQLVGSMRRQKSWVADIEMLYIGKVGLEEDLDSLFLEPIEVDLAEQWIQGLLEAGILDKRETVKDSKAYGPKNKLLVHVASGIPVDLFVATEENWYNLLVCRTGPVVSNIRISQKAKALGLKWNPYGAGFTGICANAVGEIRIQSEREVFDHVGIEYREPQER
jgi:DNA polymerase/3'-5' exonuclease PolX